MRVIGTAGHVDHGKSTLIAALTGTHPDRLKEERAREMTIDLGFARMDLPGGEMVGIVDVPGHRDFIENMLAGVGGIDAALFVVAADEGVMPQTREHLAILDILQIQAGVIVLTKIDLIEDPDWIDLVEEDISQVVNGTVLAGAPRVRVSARTRQGLTELVEVLEQILQAHPPRPDLGRPRLPIDRVFTMAGFGTVVTGTLTDGILRGNEEVEILPTGLRGRIRGLQSHNRKEDAAYPGSRTAVNISGLDVDEIQRGNVVTHPGKFRPTRMLDVQFRLLPDASSPLKHNSEVKFFLGTAEVVGRTRLLGSEELKPGESGWLQLELRDPVVALRGDHYILRRPSPGETLGGGVVVDPAPSRRHRRFDEVTLQRLGAYLEGSPAEVLFQASQSLGPIPVRELIIRARLNEDQATQAIDELMGSGLLVPLDPENVNPRSETTVATRDYWLRLSGQLSHALADYHQAYPLRRGMPKEELKSRLKIPPRLLNPVLRKAAAEGVLADQGTLVRGPEHSIHLSPEQESSRSKLREGSGGNAEPS
jgi:selenocysteine-specific elongation factor